MSESFSGACFCGAVEVEVSGQPGGASAQFRLTWLPVFEPGNASPPSNEWKLFGDNIEVAKRAGEEAWVQARYRRCTPTADAEKTAKRLRRWIQKTSPTLDAETHPTVDAEEIAKPLRRRMQKASP